MVPPNQSEMMAEAVRKKGMKVKYVTFEGEQHGFRKAENIIRSLEEELAFYRDVFGCRSRAAWHGARDDRTVQHFTGSERSRCPV